MVAGAQPVSRPTRACPPTDGWRGGCCVKSAGVGSGRAIRRERWITIPFSVPLVSSALSPCDVRRRCLLESWLALTRRAKIAQLLCNLVVDGEDAAAVVWTSRERAKLSLARIAVSMLAGVGVQKCGDAQVLLCLGDLCLRLERPAGCWLLGVDS
ncbi:hypothetical protein MANES_18G144808v8 [Manihot esculenta]|uniref:Uncharacterized protein n=1 Tax=Manihot esculenta TaxID=3983 RepID=A0ACB7G1K2_MANES|nr:hypothetical protein MANES_18G144808v8 [Manihot esculenta]